MANIITLNSPTFSKKGSNKATFEYLGYNAGTITLTGATYDPSTQVLTVTATYYRGLGPNSKEGYNSQGIYLSLNNDRTSMGKTDVYSAVGTGWGSSIGTGEYYAVRQSNTETVQFNYKSSYSTIAPLRNGGGASHGSGVTEITLTVSTVVDPEVVNSGSVPIFFRAIYGSGWKAINESRWLTDTTYKRDFSDTLKFSNSVTTYTIQYDGFGGTTPADQIKIHDVAITLAGVQTHDPLTGLTGATVTFDGMGGTASQSALTNTRDVYYTFVNWVSLEEVVCYEAGATFSANRNDTMIANYMAESVWYTIILPSATRAVATLYRNVTYNGNGGSPDKSSDRSSAKRSYVHAGWQDEYNVVQGFAGDSYIPTSNHTLYAKWNYSDSAYSALTLPSASKSSTTETRTVTLNAMGGSVSSTSLTSSATRTYKLTGWYTQSSGGTLKGKAGASYTPSASNETLYAQYSSTLSSYSSVTLPTPTRTDYNFKGWSTVSGATSGNVTSPYTPSGNVTLYAIWEEDQAKMYIQDSNKTWRKGKVFIRDENGTWRKAKKIYIKQTDGTWKLGKNS